MTATTTPTTTMKRVRFSAELHDISPSKPVLFDCQIASMFYTYDELKDFRAQATYLRKNPTACNGTTDCWRGLENRKSEGRAQRQRHIQVVMDWQIANQQRQQEGKEMTDLILESSEESRQVVRRALMYAVRDYVEALKAMQESSDVPKATASLSDRSAGSLQKPRREIATARTA